MAGAAAAGGSNQSEMVVSLEDSEGVPFRIRHALNPKEVGRLRRDGDVTGAEALQVESRELGDDERALAAEHDEVEEAVPVHVGRDRPRQADCQCHTRQR